MRPLFTFALTLFSLIAIAQPEKRSVVIGSMTTRPNALLIVNPQNSDQGVILPQLSTGQRMSMKPSSPSEDGLIVYDNNVNAYYYWSDGAWLRVKSDDGKKVGYHNIDPVNFQMLQPDNNTGHSNMAVFETDNTFVTASRNGLGEKIIAPVNLPHGALLSEVTVYYMDNDDDNIKIQLQRKTLEGITDQILAWESSAASPLINSVEFNNFSGRETIDLEKYTYRLIVTFDLDEAEEIDSPAEAGQRVYGVRIKYEE